MSGWDKAYQEALADPRARTIEDGLVMRPFHEPISGMEQLWHVYCAAHPDYGFCGIEGRASKAALNHGNSHEGNK